MGLTVKKSREGIHYFGCKLETYLRVNRKEKFVSCSNISENVNVDALTIIPTID